MDELSRLLEQVRFHESWRGYDTREVDAYVERVEEAVIWARSRIETLSERVATGSADSARLGDTDEAMAQAREQSTQMLAEAENRVEAMIAAASEESTRIRRAADEYAASALAEIESNAAELGAAAAAAERRQHTAAIAELAAERAQRQQDLDAFERQIAERRDDLERSLLRLLEFVGSAEILRTAPAALNGRAERVAASHDRVNMDAAAGIDDGIDSLFRGPQTGVQDTAAAGPAAPLGPSQDQPRFVTREDLKVRSGRDGRVEPPGVEEPPRAQLFEETELTSEAARRREDEPFLAQLREAAARDDMLTDTDDALSAFFNQDSEERRSPWFLGGR